MKLAAGYVRCSTDEQGATSIPQQKAEIEKWALANQFQIVRWFEDEGRSGTSFEERPAFRQLSKEIERGATFASVIVYDESRWGRSINLRESSYWKEHFGRHGVKVRLVYSNSKNGNDLGSLVTEVVESAEASEYSRKISRSVRRGMLSPQQACYSRGGTAPYGYKRVAIDMQTGERKNLRDGTRSVTRQEKVVYELGDPLHVATVRRIFQMRIDGMGYVAICDTLNREGVPSPVRGKTTRKDNKWRGLTIRSILHNAVYTGDNIYNRRSYSKFVAEERGLEVDRVVIPNAESEWRVYRNAFPAIVPRELFEQVNAPIGVTSDGTKPNQHYYKSSYLLTGLIKCAHCGHTFQGSRHAKTGSVSYVCGGHINKGKSVCKWFAVKKDQIEQFIMNSIKTLLLEPEMQRQIEQSLIELFDRAPSEQESKLLLYTELIQDTEGKIQNLLALVEKGTVTASILTRLEKLEGELKKLREEKATLASKSITKSDGEVIRCAVASFYKGFDASFSQGSLLDQKELIRKVVDKIIVDPHLRKVQCYIRRLPKVKGVEEIAGNVDNLLGAGSSANGNRTRI
ncbi:MAG: recombinase family protein [Ignavibacteriae bacterium]|nr:recombinase family protein [Ignavibacteria bacterium]MBI3365658.1 recombinase family protein [Ignavibacteriota bacterium]